jgi:DNA-directed RNA polymerase alpha subunit
MMNLRKVVFVLHVNRPKILRLKAQGAGTVTASLRLQPVAVSPQRNVRRFITG